MMYIFHIFLFLISPLPLYSAEILNCTELGNTYIGFDRNKGLFETSGEIKDRKNSKVTFVIEKDKGFIKGNLSSGTEVLRVGDAFIEDSKRNLILWKLIRDKPTSKIYLYQMKAYDLFGAASYTTLYICEQ